MRQVQKDWNASHIGDLTGKTALVTGANSGIGYYTALELGRHGARVIVACRDPKRGAEALARLQAEAPKGAFELEALDLASLTSVRDFAQRFNARGVALDILVNNAGVMAIPERELTADGFEKQFGTNHLGHFALTGLLLPALRKSKAPRLVALSSGMANFGRMRFDNLQGEKSYSAWRAYGATKLANLLFILELKARAPWLTSVAAHPGATHSNLQQHGGVFTKLSMKLIGQEAPIGALPSLYAATGEAQSGEYFGPRDLMQMNGPPVEVKPPKHALDAAVAHKLWGASEQLTGVRYDFAEEQRQSA